MAINIYNKEFNLTNKTLFENKVNDFFLNKSFNFTIDTINNFPKVLSDTFLDIFKIRDFKVKPIKTGNNLYFEIKKYNLMLIDILFTFLIKDNKYLIISNVIVNFYD